MKTNLNFALLLLIFSFSCSSDELETVDNLWIDSERVSCVGIDIQTCYKTQENNIIDDNRWQLFYNSIEGFDEQYESGYIYKISVTKIKINNPPADGSSIKYILNKIISKEPDIK